MLAKLDIGIIREENVGHALFANEVFKSAWYVRFKVHEVGNSFRMAFARIVVTISLDILDKFGIIAK